MVDELDVVGMAVDVGADERAQRHDWLAERPFGIERALGQGRAEARALVARVDLGVHEVRPAAAADVPGEADELAVEPDLVAATAPGSTTRALVGDVIAR